MPAFDIERFVAKFRIQTWPAGTKNVPAGCIGVNCPFCGDRSNHLHFKIGTFKAKCWRCGPKRVPQVVAALLRVSDSEARTVVNKFVTSNFQNRRIPFQSAETRTAQRVILPAGCGPLGTAHQKYLFSRGFDPYELELLWGLMGTNHLDPDYRWRIIAPIMHNSQMVSFHSRDVTGGQELKARSCRPENEVIPHKSLLYGAHMARRDVVVVVEGIADAWRLGPGAVATFGANWTMPQALSLIGGWSRIFILYDPDEGGRKGAFALYEVINPLHSGVNLLELAGAADPGEMPPAEARHLMERELKAR